MSLLKITFNHISVPVQPGLHSAGRSLFWLFIAASAIAAARADQCEYFDGKTAYLVQNQIKTGDILLNYCEPCDMPEPLPLRIRNLSIEKEEAPPEFRLLINGEIRDLAYLYYRADANAFTYRNIGVIAGCADGVSLVITYKFPDKGQAPGPPESPHFENITGVCFDGSCLLGTWKVSKEATLRADHAEDSTAVVIVPAGETLQLVRIVSEVKPVHARVVFDQGRFLEGDDFYVLNSLGEGYFRVWYYGRVVEEEILGVSMEQTENGDWATCPEPDANCWAEARGIPEEIWWAEVKTRDGRQGWLREPASFVEDIFEPE